MIPSRFRTGKPSACFGSSILASLLLLAAGTQSPVHAAAPAAPTGLTASMTFPLSAPTSHAYLFQWTDNATDEYGYELWARLGTSGAFSLLGNVAADSSPLVWNLKTFPAGTVLQFQIRAYRGSTTREYSAFSNVASVTIPSSQVMTAPGSLAVVEAPRDTLDLIWTDNATQEEFYAIEYKKHTASNFEFYALPYFNITKHSLASGLEPGVEYDFRVRALRNQSSVNLAIDPKSKILTDDRFNSGEFASQAIISNNPAIAFYNRTSGKLKYVRANDVSGGSWNVQTINAGGASNEGAHASLQAVSGNPAVSYYDVTNGDLKYVRASDTNGTSWAASVSVDTTGDVGTFTSLAVVNGRPAIAYYDGTNEKLKYVRANNAEGTTWGTPITLDASGKAGQYASMCVVNGFPAVTYYKAGSGDLRYIIASDADGTAWGTPVTVDGTNDVGGFPSLKVINGSPAISYYDVTNADLKYVRATDASGATWGSPVTVDSTGSVGAYTSLSVVNSNPAIAYHDSTNGTLKFVRASNADGSAWNTAVVADAGPSAGFYASLAVTGTGTAARPVIGYYYSGNSDLRWVQGSDVSGAAWGSFKDPESAYFGTLGTGNAPSTLVYSAASNVVTYTIPNSLTAPTQFVGTALDEDTIRLNWFDESDHEHGYAIEFLDPSATSPSFQAVPGSDGQPLYTSANATSFQMDVPPGKTVQWRVLAMYKPASGSIVYSAPTSAVTLTPAIRPPTALAATVKDDLDTGDSTVNLTWVDNSSVETAYYVFSRVVGTTAFEKVAEFAAGSTSASLNTATYSTLHRGQPIELVVRAAVYEGQDSTTHEPIYNYSADSNIVKVTTRSGITSSLTKRFVQGQAVNYTVETSGGVTRTGWTVTGLPAGVNFDTNTGVISGTPTEFGVFNVKMTATFADGWTDNATFVLRLVRPPGSPTPIGGDNHTIGMDPVTIPLSSLFQDADAESAVRVATSKGDVDIILYPGATPKTVENFMAYVNAGDYNGVSVHRAVSGFVVQGGAYKPASSPDYFTSVAARTSPKNEPGISNVRGTVAMAKLGGQPDSATHDFFFNLADNNNATNPESLDNQNEGFTVFGRVAGNGMNVVDTIAALPKSSYSIHLDGSSSTTGPFENWPVNDTSAPSSMDITKLVLMNTVSSMPTMGFTAQVLAGADTEAPVISAPSGGFTSLNLPVAPGQNATLPDYAGQATASDNVGVSGSITQSPPVGQSYDETAAGQVEVTLSATDAAGNTGTLRIIANINDGSLPEITTVPADRALTADGMGNYAAPDLTGEIVVNHTDYSVTQSPTAGSALSTGRHDITLTVTDNQTSKLSKAITHVTVPASGGASTDPAVSASVSGENLVLQGLIAGRTAQVKVSATDLDGNTVDRTMNVTVENGYAAPVITTQPQDVTVNTGEQAVFNVDATGNDLTFQWRKNGANLDGQNGATLTIASAEVGDAGSYTVAITNAARTLISGAATLTVQGAPKIMQHPADATRPYGYSATFSVTAIGPGAFTYQWLRDNVAIGSATGSSYTISNLQMSDSGRKFKVQVTNSTGSTTSNEATLTVTPVDSDGDGAPDHVEAALGTSNTKTDTDGDGYSDGAEVEFGSNPALASSKPTNYFVAQTDALAALQGVAVKGIPATPIPSTFEYSQKPSGETTRTVDAFWLAAQELTNRQFAAVLQYAKKNLATLSVGAPDGNGRREVTCQGKKVCRLATHLAGETGNLGVSEVDYSAGTDSFFVKTSVANHPARGITWYGAYLATQVFNQVAGHTSKCIPATWNYDMEAVGYYLPRDDEWEWAARAGSSNLAYPTGATISTTVANYKNVPGKTRPVGSYAANPFGISDLAGNVAEWVFETHGTNDVNSYTRGGSWSDVPGADGAPMKNSQRVEAARETVDSRNGVRVALKGDRTRDTDNDGYTDMTELALGSSASSAASKPTAWFVAAKDGLPVLKGVALSRVLGTTSPSAFEYSQGTPGQMTDVPAFWMSSHELTNRQLAAVLQRAYKDMGIVQVVVNPADDSRSVKYQNQTVCVLPTVGPDADGNLGVKEVDYDPASDGFYVKESVADYPARGVSWHGAYLATVVLNQAGGFTSKCIPASWGYTDGVDGYYLPKDSEWEWAAGSGTAALPFPTGATITTAQANYAGAVGKTRPVGSYSGNAASLFDLAGNVAEWVFETDSVSNLQGFTRGGGWSSVEADTGNQQRASTVKDLCSPLVGMRVAFKGNRNTDTDQDGYTDLVEQTFGSNAALASSKPTGWFVAQTDALATLQSLIVKRVEGNGTTVSTFWLAGREMTNREFASVLQRACKDMGIVEITTRSDGRREVQYQGKEVCLLATHKAGEPGALAYSEVDWDSVSDSFFVKTEVANHPVRGVSWYGAYLATAVLNQVAGYPNKCVPAEWRYDSSVNGYYLPADFEWEWAARGGAANLAYPTGATISTAMANYGSVAGKTKPVGSYAANVLGLFDLAGNVAEWVFDDNASTARTRGGGWSDALVPATGAPLKNDQSVQTSKDTVSNRIGVRVALQDDRAPSFTTPPASVIVTKDQAINLTSVWAGSPVITGQWLKNNTALTGRTSPTLTIPAPKLTDAGTYKVRIQNSIGLINSADAFVSVVDLPSIAQQVSTTEDKPVTFSVPTGGDLVFEWKKNGVTLSNDATHTIAVTGTATGPVGKLTLNRPKVEDAGTYACTVKRTGTTSPTVTINFVLSVVTAKPTLMLGSAATTILNADVTYAPVFDTHPLRTPTSFLVTGLPAGMKFNSATGQITGKPTVSGTFVVFVTATNAAGSDTQGFYLTVQGLDPNTVGGFVALVERHAQANENLGGRLDLTTTTSGGYSGTLKIGAGSYIISGALNATVNTNSTTTGGNVSLQKVISRTGKSSVQLDVTIDATTKLVTGTLKELGGSTTATVNGWRNTWTTTNQPTSRLGYHTFALDIPSALDHNVAVPQGAGYGTLTVTTTGTATVSGTLSDGSPYSSSAAMGPSGQVLVWQLLNGNTGSVLGTLSVGSDTEHLVSGTLNWRKADQGSASTDRVYKTGIGLNLSTPLNLTAFGAKYAARTSDQIMLGAAVNETTLFNALPGNCAMIFGDGGLASPSTTANVPGFQMNPVSAILMPAKGGNNPAGASLTVNAGTGTFSGAFTLTDGAVLRAQNHQGIIVRDTDGLLRGYGWFLLPQLPGTGETINTSPKLSGAVMIQKK